MPTLQKPLCIRSGLWNYYCPTLKSAPSMRSCWRNKGATEPVCPAPPGPESSTPLACSLRRQISLNLDNQKFFPCTADREPLEFTGHETIVLLGVLFIVIDPSRDDPRFHDLLAADEPPLPHVKIYPKG